MSFTLLSVFVLILFVMIAALGVYNGMKRGFRLSLIYLGTIVLSLFFSFFVTRWISDAVATALMGLFVNNEVYRGFADILPTLDFVLPDVLSMAISAILYLFVFLILLVLLRLAARGIYWACTRRRDDDPGYGSDSPEFASKQSRAAGAVCGILAAIILTTTVLSPVMGVLEFADDALNIVKQTSTVAYQALGPGNAALVHSFTEDPVGNLFYRGGGRAIFNGAASTSVTGHRVYLLDEADAVSKMSVDMLSVYIVFCKPQEATREHAQAMRRLAAELRALDLCARLSADIVKQGAAAWHKNEPFLQLSPPQMNGVMRPVFDEILAVCANTNYYNVNQNMDTMLEVYALIVESGILNAELSNAQDAVTILERSGTIRKIEMALAENPYMAHIHASSIAMAAFSLHLEETVTTEHKEVMGTTLAQAINEARLSSNGNAGAEVAALSLSVRQVADAEKMTLSEEFGDFIAEQLLSELPGTAVTGKDVASLLEQYVERYTASEEEIPGAEMPGEAIQ